jgi:hypothetical protein
MNDNKSYVITGNMTKETISNLLYNINTAGFFWRGFTDREKQMIPSAAFYGLCKNGGIEVFRKTNNIQQVSIPGELERIARHINNRNKLGEYPFEMPEELYTILFPYTHSETDFLKNLQMDCYPKSNLLLQAASYVQHYFSGTSLLDFSVNPLKALYFAIGKDDTLKNDSWLFGMPIKWFQAHKYKFSANPSDPSSTKYKFDLYLPSYYKNIRIRNQEGIFIYQLFDIESFSNGTSYYYKNILDLFEERFHCSNTMDLKDIEERSKNSHSNGFMEIHIFYILLKVPKEEKPYLKHYLNSIRVNDNFMGYDKEA